MAAPPRRDRVRERPAAGGEPLRSSGAAPRRVPVSNASFARVAEERLGVLPGGGVHPAVERAIASQAGHGRTLDAGVASRLGRALGDPLTDVRVHTGAIADALARAVSARAFTVRRDVFFARGEYRPDSAAGRRLLAHELTHAVQQRDAPTSGPLRVTDPTDRYEREAERAAADHGG